MTIAFVFMASGFGSRFGSNKLMYRLDGKPLYLHALTNLIEASKVLSKDYTTKIVVASQYEDILKDCESHGVMTVYNPDSEKGITASLKLGVQAVPEAEHYAFFVADQPYFKPETTVDFILRYLQSGKTIGCVTDGENWGNPVIFSENYRCELLSLEGDKGGKQVMGRHLDNVYYYKTTPHELFDLDKPEDIEP